jgi:pyruvate dehydrogenase E1 component
VAISDYMTAVPDQVARWVPGRFTPLGTDGFGRSDTREALRHFFEVDTGHVVVGVLSGLSADGLIDDVVVKDAIARYGIDPNLPDPWAA